MTNRFRPYNKSMLVNVFMSKEYNKIYVWHYIPNYHFINCAVKYECVALIFVCSNNCINIARLLLSHPYINVNVTNKAGTSVLSKAIHYNNLKLIMLLKNHPNFIGNR